MIDLLLVMGVSGCGKSTVGTRLAERLGGSFLEGDDFHPPENKRLMGAGVPLTDTERWPWFDILRSAIDESLGDEKKRPVVLSCSALKRSYRDYLLRGFEGRSRIIFLEGSFELIHGRMESREHEYMPASLLESQFATLEAPAPEENAIQLSIEHPAEELVEAVLAELGSS